MRLKKYKFNFVTSTNDKALSIIKKTNKNSGIILANNQSKGRGRYGKKWISYNGNLFMSVFFNIDKLKLTKEKLSKLNFMIIKKVLKKYCNKRIQIKFPNDILVEKRKICGILQEKFMYKKSNFLIIGIGINLVKNPKIRNYPTTCLSNITNYNINRELIFKDIKKTYEHLILGSRALKIRG